MLDQFELVYESSHTYIYIFQLEHSIVNTKRETHGEILEMEF